MNEQRNNGRGIFYGVIGVATLVVAIVGATFAYFTATESTDDGITGNMATVKLGLSVKQISTADTTSGMIPMSNGMVEHAINKSPNNVCVDDNGNAVCQIYEIIVTNDSSAAQYVDGYVALKNGSGTSKDESTATTTMRWAQVFKGDGKVVGDETDPSKTNGAIVGDYSTAGVTELGADTEHTFTQIGEDPSEPGSKGHNTVNIKKTIGDVTANTTIKGSPYLTINRNYIRTSIHAWTDGVQSYSRTNDITSALVFSQYLEAKATGTYYIVVWLSETGTNQTTGELETSGATANNPGAYQFFSANVTFISAAGSEVSASFAGHTRTPATTPTASEPTA